MPTTAGTRNFPVPTLPDSNNPPADFMALAVAVSDDLDELQNSTLGSTSATRKRIHKQTIASQTLDGNGLATFSHAAGFVPTCVWLINAAPGGNFAVFWGADSYTATTFRARFFSPAGGTPVTSGSQIGIFFE